MTYAHIITIRGKRYVSFYCEFCGRRNRIPLDLFLPAYVNGGEIHCTYCGTPNHLDLEKRLENIVDRYRGRRKK